MKPLCFDLFSGLGGWSAGFMEQGYECIGFDIERHQYGDQRYPAQLVLQDVRTIHGRQFRDAAVIVASPPCQAYSYMSMPWSRAKKMAAEIRADASGEKLRQLNSSSSRKAASAQIAKIPFVLSQWIAQCYDPRRA